jgi:hypothetical protein
MPERDQEHEHEQRERRVGVPEAVAGLEQAREDAWNSSVDRPSAAPKDRMTVRSAAAARDRPQQQHQDQQQPRPG